MKSKKLITDIERIPLDGYPIDKFPKKKKKEKKEPPRKEIPLIPDLTLEELILK